MVVQGLKERIDSARKSIRANASPPSSRKRLSYAAVTNASRGNEGGRGSRDGMLEESSVSVSFSDLEKQFEEIQRELHPAKSPCVARESFQSSSPRRDSAGCKSGDQSSPPTCERVVGGAGRTPSPSEASRKSPVSSSDESGAGSRSEQSKVLDVSPDCFFFCFLELCSRFLTRKNIIPDLQRSLVGALAAVGGNADSSSHRIKNSSNRARGWVLFCPRLFLMMFFMGDYRASLPHEISDNNEFGLAFHIALGRTVMTKSPKTLRNRRCLLWPKMEMC